MRKQVLLIQPPVEDFYSTDCRTQPLGLCYLSAAIKKNFPGIDVAIYDAAAGGAKKGKKSVPLPPEFNYLKKYYGVADKSPFKLFHHYYRFGKSREEMREDLAGYSPFLIGISSMFTAYYRQSLETAELCREIFPEAKIVMGGHHATAAPESLLTARGPGGPLVDYVIPSEAEDALVRLISSLQSGRSVARGLLENPAAPDINSLPHPDIEALEAGAYRFNGKPMCFLVTSRGCPYRCSFCGIHSVFGQKYRRRDNDDILREIETRVGRGFRHIDIEDDHFTAHKEKTAQLLDALIAKKWPLTFSAMNGLVYWSLDAVLLEKMKKAGFDALNLSYVSADESQLQNAGRPYHDQKFTEIVKMAHGEGLFVTAYFIAGRPGQTVSETAQTLRFLASQPVLCGVSPYYLCPGTPDYDRWKNRAGKIAPENPAGIVLGSFGRDSYLSARLSALDVETGDFNRDDIYTLFRMSRVVNFIKGALDRGAGKGDAGLQSALDIFAKRRWSAATKNQDVELPISQAVMEELLSEPFEICGTRSAKRLTIGA